MVWPSGTLKNVHRKVKLQDVLFTYCTNAFLYIINILSSHYFTGPVFGNMDNFTGLGVFVDTYPNEEKHLEVCWSGTAQVVCGEGK